MSFSYRGRSGRVVDLILLAAMPLHAKPRRADFLRERSHIVARTDKSGILSFLAGHKHGILVTDWEAHACYDPGNPSVSSLRITVPTSSLQIDSDRARRLAGLDPDGGPKAETVRDLQKKMLSENNLSAQQHPALRFEAQSLSREGSHLILRGPLTIRGRTRTASIPVTVTSLGGDRYKFRGEFQVKQSDFGIKPASVAGVVNVADEVTVQFVMQAEMTDGECQ